MDINSKRIHLIAVVAATVLTAYACSTGYIAPGTEQFANIRRLAIVMGEEPDFTLIFHQTKSTAVPSILFGYLGHGIASIHYESMDSELAKIITSAPGLSCRLVYLESFCSILNDSRRFASVDVFNDQISSEKVKRYEAVIRFTISKWGVQLVDEGVVTLRPFTEIEAEMIRSSNNSVIWKERQMFVNKLGHTFEFYVENKMVLQEEIRETIVKVSQRMAQLILNP